MVCGSTHQPAAHSARSRHGDLEFVRPQCVTVASPPSQPKTGFSELSAGGARLLDAYKALGLPARGVTTTVALGGSAQPCSFSRPRQRDEDCSGRLGLLEAFRSLSVPNFLLLFACMLLERQIVVTHDAISVGPSSFRRPVSPLTIARVRGWPMW